MTAPNTMPRQSHSQRKRALRVRRKREAQIRARLNQDERSEAAWARLEKLLKK